MGSLEVPDPGHTGRHRVVSSRKTSRAAGKSLVTAAHRADDQASDRLFMSAPPAYGTDRRPAPRSSTVPTTTNDSYRPRDTPTHPLVRGRVHPHPTRQRASDVWLHRVDRIGGSWPLAMLRPAADPRRAGPRLWEATCRGWAMGYRSPSLHRRRAGRCHVPPPTIRASARGESVVHSGRWPPDGFARPIRGHGGAVRSLWAGVDLGGLRVHLDTPYRTPSGALWLP